MGRAPEAHYLGDNGRVYCGLHSGTSARFTGRDISGQPVELVTVETLRAEGIPASQIALFACEECGRGVTTSAKARP